jgi:hypothetical protein
MAETRLCVFCRLHQVEPAWRPFCSERCKLQDLARWADGSYRLAANEADEEDSTPDDEGGSED